MSKENNGGPAYPCQELDDKGGARELLWQGMTIRDYFAGQALIGLLSNPTNDPLQPDEYANDAHNIADAMIERRNK